MAVPLMSKKSFIRSGEGSIASYDWTDIADGSGYTSFFPTIVEDSAYQNYFLATNIFPSSTLTGLMDLSSIVGFRSFKFLLPRRIKGRVIVSGYVGAGTGALTCSLKKESGQIVLGGLGNLLVSSAGEATSSSDSFTLIKTVIVGDYVNKVTGEIRESSGQGQVRYKFVYKDYGSSDVDFNCTSSYVAVTADNPHRGFYVSKIEVYGRNPTSAESASERETKVYQEIISGITTTTLDSKTTRVLTDAQGFSVGLDCDEQINIGDELILELSKTTGSVVVDPTLSIQTNPSLKVDIPFRIDI